MSVLGADRTWHLRLRISSPGDRPQDMAPRWAWTRVDTGTRDAFRNSDDGVLGSLVGGVISRPAGGISKAEIGI